ncbi:MAG: M23 family metallopeptidase [Chloroflexi bacterium]|nr:M23 family metallopeptidase [Chloroflexota bacterium]
MSNQTYTPNTEPSPRKSHATKLWIPIFLLAAIAVYLIFSDNSIKSPKDIIIPTPPIEQQTPLETLLYTQLPELIHNVGEDNWTLDDIHFNESNTQAVLWMAENDPETGETLAREPEIVLAVWDEAAGSWNLHLTSDPEFIDFFMTTDFKDDEIADRFFSDADPKSGPSPVVLGGYKLPWAGGLTKRVTWSVGHTSCNPKYYCTYAFDFADGTMFDLLAAKDGYVYHWRDTCNNGDSGCTNSITLEDRTTNPWTYQIYLHIAKDSIPESVKIKGVYISQGMKIANVDDTGASTGHHVHFMVVEQTTLNTCKNYCFGKAVDITFNDVDINWDEGTQGGRPRLAAEAKWYGGTGRTNYVSGNTFKPGPWSRIVPFIIR